MTAGIATLPLEHSSKASRRRSTSPACGGLREFLIGPENQLVQYGIGLVMDDSSSPPHLEICDSPLLVWAPTGFGKSQLLHGIAATWKHHRADDQVILATASEFMHAFVHAHKIDDVPEFQQRFRRADLVLIDDLNAICERDPSQQQLASIIDHRRKRARPTVFTANQPLASLNLQARLHSRISAGLCIPLQLPARETRSAILDRMCRQRELQLAPDARDWLLGQDQLSVPLLASMIRQASDLPAPIDASQVQALMGSTHSHQVDPKAIIRSTARHFGLKIANLTGSSRRKMDTQARGVAMFLIRDLTTLSFHDIGQLFGGRDHSTVMHACRKIKGMIGNDASCRNAIRELSQTHAAPTGAAKRNASAGRRQNRTR